MKEIKLTQGYSTWVEDKDFESLSKFRWKVIKNKNKVYAARSAYTDGKWKTIYMHREIISTTLTVDHVDGNGLNNLRNNLREASRKQQAQNRKNLKSVSGYKGVDIRGSRFRAYIGNMQLIGNFDSAREAALAYNVAALGLYGNFARLNDV